MFTMIKTIFDSVIINREHIVWENESHIAFLTPFPNSPGATVVTPKENIGDYVFSLPAKEYSQILSAVKEVAKILEKAFNTPRIAVVFEGTGVPYVHAKLYPLIGHLANQTDVWSQHVEYSNEYRGFITTAEGPKMGDEELKAIYEKIIASSKE
jgi:diadenosine tetraphosphate (Ap4A) HIT family hydrolase